MLSMPSHCFVSLLEVAAAAAAAVAAGNHENAAAGIAAVHDRGVVAATAAVASSCNLDLHNRSSLGRLAAAEHTPLTVERVVCERTVVDKFQ